MKTMSLIRRRANGVNLHGTLEHGDHTTYITLVRASPAMTCSMIFTGSELPAVIEILTALQKAQEEAPKA
jgi:hypothetical protein